MAERGRQPLPPHFPRLLSLKMAAVLDSPVRSQSRSAASVGAAGAGGLLSLAFVVMWLWISATGQFNEGEVALAPQQLTSEDLHFRDHVEMLHTRAREWARDESTQLSPSDPGSWRDVSTDNIGPRARGERGGNAWATRLTGAAALAEKENRRERERGGRGRGGGALRGGRERRHRPRGNRL